MTHYQKVGLRQLTYADSHHKSSDPQCWRLRYSELEIPAQLPWTQRSHSSHWTPGWLFITGLEQTPPGNFHLLSLQGPGFISISPARSMSITENGERLIQRWAWDDLASSQGLIWKSVSNRRIQSISYTLICIVEGVVRVWLGLG